MILSACPYLNYIRWNWGLRQRKPLMLSSLWPRINVKAKRRRAMHCLYAGRSLVFARQGGVMVAVNCSPETEREPEDAPRARWSRGLHPGARRFDLYRWTTPRGLGGGRVKSSP